MEENKILICIGRQLGSGGHLVAQTLSERLGAKLYDKEILSLAAKESGFCEEFFEMNDERNSFFDVPYQWTTGLLNDAYFYPNRFSQQGIFQYQSQAIQTAAQSGSCVFVGRCADYVLRDRPNVVNVFITANDEDRIARVVERFNCSERKAREAMEKGDENRAEYYKFYTGKTWGQAGSYELCVDTSSVGIEGAADIIECFLKIKNR